MVAAHVASAPWVISWLLVIVGGLAAVLAALVWLARHVRRRGTAGAAVAAVLASWEEAYRVTAHEFHWPSLTVGSTYRLTCVGVPGGSQGPEHPPRHSSRLTW